MSIRSTHAVTCFFTFAALICLGGCPNPGANTDQTTDTDPNLAAAQQIPGPAGPEGPAGPAGPVGPAGADGADGADGTNRIDGIDGTDGSTGATGPMGPAGPIDDTIPPAPTGLRISSHIHSPPSFTLHWVADSVDPAIQYFVIYESTDPITTPDETLIIDAVPGADRQAEILLYQNSGERHFRVSAVSYTGIESPLSVEYVQDTTARLAFVADLDTFDVNELHIVSAGGGDPQKMSGTMPADGDVLQYEWSPDGRRLAFVADKAVDEQYDLFLVNASNGVPGRISESLAYPSGQQVIAWSPDATRIAYLSDQEVENVFALHVVDVLTRNSINVSGPLVTHGDVGHFAWSPVGDQLAFLADAEVNGQVELYVVAADGSDRISVSGTLDADENVEQFEWSPDGRQLAFLADLETPDKEELYVVSAAGGLVTKLNPPFDFFLDDVRQLAWSPDSTRIAYQAGFTSSLELFVTPATGAAPILISDTLSVHSFAWSPDGTQLGIHGRDPALDIYGVYTTPAGGGGLNSVTGTLPLSPSGIQRFNWSPSGQFLSYAANTIAGLDREEGIYTADPMGGEPFKASGDLVADGRALSTVWSPDGTQLGFVAEMNIVRKRELFVVSALGAKPLMVIGPMSDDADVTRVAWSPLSYD